MLSYGHMVYIFYTTLVICGGELVIPLLSNVLFICHQITDTFYYFPGKHLALSTWETQICTWHCTWYHYNWVSWYIHHFILLVEFQQRKYADKFLLTLFNKEKVDISSKCIIRPVHWDKMDLKKNVGNVLKLNVGNLRNISDTIICFV